MKNRLRIAVAFCWLVFGYTLLQADRFIVNSGDSSIRFQVTKMLVVDVDGEFSKFSGYMITQGQKLSAVVGEVDTASVDTNNNKRDSRLQEAGYFNTQTFPKLLFNSTAINKQSLQAEVSIKGIKQRIVFQIDKLDVTEDTIILHISATVNRSDFALNGAKSDVIREAVKVEGKLVAYKE